MHKKSSRGTGRASTASSLTRRQGMPDHVMTDELREQMIGLLPFSVDATFDTVPSPYLLKKDDGEYVIPEEFRPVFTVRSMTKKEIEEFKGKGKKKEVDDTVMVDMVAKVVVGWKNLWDAGTKKQIEYKADSSSTGADRDVFCRIPLMVVADLAVTIIKMNGILGIEYLGLKS